MGGQLHEFFAGNRLGHPLMTVETRLNNSVYQVAWSRIHIPIRRARETVDIRDEASIFK
jgi:hypothetical protein